MVPLPALPAPSLTAVLFRVMTLPVWEAPGVAVRVAVHVRPPSLLPKLLRMPSATVKAPTVSPVTASLKVMVTRDVLPLILSAVSDTTMVEVGSTVSIA